ncbi:hypothetical protein HHI36_009972 [Cryptolaemus montrouzieri]|uniref:CCHC-type domain-containing protein n=1 Tax=Cryptolaemus montrouzieri TaxID=559131 RepID=A0ABD2MHE4_9CUCU
MPKENSIYPNLNVVTREEALGSNTQTSECDYISLEIAEKFVFKFDGTKSKLHKFIDNCDEAFRLVKPQSKRVLFSIIKTRITDNARALIRNRDFEDWDLLKQFLVDSYSEKRTYAQRQFELGACKQNANETVLSFSNRLESCYVHLLETLDPRLPSNTRLTLTDLFKEQALGVFINGLNKDLSVLVKSQKPSTLEEAVVIATSEEQELKSKNEMSKFQNFHNNLSSKFCTFCNKAGHNNFNCRSKNKSQINIVQNQRQITQRNATNTQASNSIKICRYCKKHGHEIQECRKRIFNENKRKKGNENSVLETKHSSNKPGPSSDIKTVHTENFRKVPRETTACSVNAKFQE